MQHQDSYIVVKEFTDNGKKTSEVIATGVTKQGFIDAYTEKGCVMRGGENPHFEDIYSGVVFKIEPFFGNVSALLPEKMKNGGKLVGNTYADLSKEMPNLLNEGENKIPIYDIQYDSKYDDFSFAQKITSSSDVSDVAKTLNANYNLSDDEKICITLLLRQNNKVHGILAREGDKPFETKQEQTDYFKSICVSIPKGIIIVVLSKDTKQTIFGDTITNLKNDLENISVRFLDVVFYAKNGEFVSLADESKMKLGGGVKKYADLSKDMPNVVMKNGGELSLISEINFKKQGELLTTNQNVIQSSSQASKIFFEFWDKNKIQAVEEFCVMAFNSRNRCIGIYKHSLGGLSGTISDPILICAFAIKLKAKGIIVCHNHPSDNLMPSNADKKMTRQIKSSLEMVGVNLVDSLIIVPSGNYFSFFEDGIMENGGGLNSFADGGAIREDFSESRTTEIYESKYFQSRQVSDRVSVEYSGEYDAAYISSEINLKDENLSDERFYITSVGVSKLHSILGKLVEHLIETTKSDFYETRKTDEIESKGLMGIVINEIIVEYFAETETINIESLVRYENDYLIKSGSAYFSIGGVFKLYSILENLMNFFAYGRKMNDGGEVNENRERDIQIAKTILMQLGGSNRLQMFTGAYNFVAVPYGVSFRIKNRKVNYVKIVLNAMDTYDVEFGLIRGANFKVVKELNGIYNDQLVEVFTRHTGMALPLREGGAIQGEENAEMVMNQNLQIRHHTEELEEILKSGKEVPAWVVSKLSRAADSISDATHYLKGTPDKMAMGGKPMLNDNSSFDAQTLKKKYAEMRIATNTKTGQVYVGGLKPKNKLLVDEQGYYTIQGYGTFAGKKYQIKNHFPPLEQAVLRKYLNDESFDEYDEPEPMPEQDEINPEEIRAEIEALEQVLEVLEGDDRQSIQEEIEILKIVLDGQKR